MLTLVHTSAVHVARFDAVRDAIAPGTALRHIVRPDWLAQAMEHGITPDLADDVETTLRAAAPALLTCTTLGVLADTAGATRIDRPLMEQAAQIGGTLCLAYCLDSTADSSTALLSDCIAEAGTVAQIAPLALPHAWAFFEAGDQAGFARTIAAGVRAHLAQHPDTRAVILAQASMDVAAPLLHDIGIPVLTPAHLALQQALGHR